MVLEATGEIESGKLRKLKLRDGGKDKEQKAKMLQRTREKTGE